jgi:hypothetical protein
LAFNSQGLSYSEYLLMRYETAGHAKDGTRILKQQRPVTRQGTITMAQARKIVREVRGARGDD